MDLIYWFSLMIPFTFHPERTVAVSLVFFLCYLGAFFGHRKFLSLRSLPILICAVMWALFTIWEIHCEAIGANIRADLFFIAPVLIIASIVSLFLSIIALLSYIIERIRK